MRGSIVAASGEGKVTVVRPGETIEVVIEADSSFGNFNRTRGSAALP